jgi:hypothetical protein
MSGANPVRGGFDSHTFPPVFLWAPPAANEEGPGGPWARVVESKHRRIRVVFLLAALGVFLPLGYGYGQGRDEQRGVSPRSSLLMSTVLPGWGQVANGHPVKGALCFAAGAGLLGSVFIEGRRATLALERARASTTNAEYLHHYDAYSRHFSRREDRAWWAVFFWLYAMIDAYVDAHLAGFDEEFEGEPTGDTLRPWAQLVPGGFKVGIRIGAVPPYTGSQTIRPTARMTY